MPKRTSRKSKIIIQKARVDDIEAVFNIEAVESSHPWKKSYFLAEIANEISHFYVARDLATADILGYIVFWIIEDILELHNLAIKDTFKRRGVATALMSFMLDLAANNSVKQMFLEVRLSNARATALYEKFGFKPAGRRKDYYRSPVEDALILRKILDPEKG